VVVDIAHYDFLREYVRSRPPGCRREKMSRPAAIDVRVPMRI
jgi:hypothetical protein